ncbi:MULTISPECIES: AAA family ATPase [unclassified Nodularia (in: cyanobacteria)]|uniref:AAA family ATPase n=1 Tax=unclassified Nodularia (in: cyanobacteria) TaxID=2656917 RepID=UPI00187DF4E3|nr:MULTISPECIES: AAA family ATPase [unclassified Nodularia (in: cyanobacteria)]MBE9200664.1 AAA family ATPase [Nodularia sp. LEGE 06071]MCC2694805.1 AAA family ATPase [Nodularia sp. LEGE 04288]
MPFNPELCRNESEVESKLIVQYLLPQLGYTPDTWHQEVALGSIRLDFLAFAVQVIPLVLDANSPMSVVMEAKHPRQNLNNHFLRLRHYLTSLNVRYGLLTNGKEIRIYEKLKSDLQLVFQCSGKDVETEIGTIRGLIGRNSLLNIQFMGISDNQTSENNLGFESKRKHSMKIIAIYHNKGGVGKTTVTVNLAAALRKTGKRVLVIDLDSQANTTLATGLIKFDDEELDDLKDCNIGNILLSEAHFPIQDVARTSIFTNPEIDVVPAHINLMEAESVLIQRTDSKVILMGKLNVIKENYDIVILDTPPAINLFSEIALITADYLLIPSDLKPFANQGLLNVKEFIKRIDNFRKYISKTPITILGVLPCKISTNAKFIQSTLPKRLEQITKRYGLNVMDTVIYEREDLAKCSEQVKVIGAMEVPDPRSILDFKPNSTSAQELTLLAIEVLQKIGMAE